MLRSIFCTSCAPKRFSSAIALMRKPRLFTSANSAATKNALAASRKSASSRLMIVAVIVAYARRRAAHAGQFLREEVAHLRGIDIGRDERLPDAAHQDEGQLAAPHLLVLRDQLHQGVRIGLHRRHVADAGSAVRRRQDGAPRARRRPAAASRAGPRTRTRRRCRARPLRHAAACRKSPPPPRTHARRCGRD